MPSIGEQLRAARAARGLSLQDVKAELRIREKYLQAMEADDFASIPGLVYARGFLRSYAKYLGLDPDALTGALPMAAPPTERNEPAAPEPARPVPMMTRKPIARSTPARQWPWVVLPILFLALLLYYFGSRRPATGASGGTPPTHQKKKSTPPPTTTGNSQGGSGGTTGTQGSPPALTAQPATQAPPPLGGPQANYTAATGPISATLVLSGPCWVYVTQDGSVVTEAVEPSGTYSFSAQSSLFIKVGNPPAAQLTIDGESVPLPGTAAESVAVNVQG